MSDVFDALLITTLSVLERTPGAGDDYGISPTSFTALDSGVPCRISSKAMGRPKEFKAGKKSSLAYKTVFMRPWANGTLTEHHWLQIGDEIYDIQRVDKLYLSDPTTPHHLEVLVELQTP